MSASKHTGTIFAIFLVIVTGSIRAQPVVSAERLFTNIISDTTLYLDAWVVPSSIKLEPRSVFGFSYSMETGQISLLLNGIPPDTLRILYKKNIFGIQPIYQNRVLTSVRKDSSSRAIATLSNSKLPDDLFEGVNLNRSGSLTRGLTVGTGGNVALESGLRFEMSGNLTDDLYLFATLTDQNTPIQPDGSTQNLREFDLVYIKLQSSQGLVELGDVDVVNNKSYFGRISRRLQGISVQGKPHSTGDYAFSVAAPRGTFNTVQFLGQDGVQGPYRLGGRSGEQFVIVVAGTERVYIDGELLIRGEDNDYIIDYGLGEIFFTSSRLITDLHRIVIDYQYIDSQYNKLILTTDSEVKIGKSTTVGVSYLREADNDDLLLSGFSDDEVRAIRDAGNSSDGARLSGIREFDNERDEGLIAYERRDTLYGSESYIYYQATTKQDVPLFRVRFSNLGQGNGDYIRVGQSLNGVIYEWVGPNLGQYDTVRVITPPALRQMVTARSRTMIGENASVSTEYGLSLTDPNRLSGLGDNQNQKQAYKIDLSTGEQKWLGGNFSASLNHESIENDYYLFDRIYDAEFYRKWNINQDAITGNDISSATIRWSRNDFLSSAQAGLLSNDTLKSYRAEHRLTFLPQKGFQLSTITELIATDNDIQSQNTTWFRERGNAGFKWNVGNWLVFPNVAYEAEQRNQDQIGIDSLNQNTFSFLDIRPELTLSQGQKLTLFTRHSVRTDYKEYSSRLKREATGTTHSYGLKWNPSQSFRHNTLVQFRRREFSELFQTLTNNSDSEGILMRSDSRYVTKDRWMQVNVFYEANSERRARLQETYIEVGPQLGQYVWDDLNGDTIQQIDEFFPEQTPNEGTFIRQFIPSDELLPVVALNTRLRFRLEPYRLLRNNTEWWAKIFKNINSDSQFDMRENSTNPNLSDIYLLRTKTFLDPQSTLQGRRFFRQSFRFFPLNATFNAELNFDTNKGLVQQAAGYEDQFSRNIEVLGMYRSKGYWNAQLSTKIGENSVFSENFENRNFNFSKYQIEPEISWRLEKLATIRLTPRYAWFTDKAENSDTKATNFKLRNRNDIYYTNRLQMTTITEYRATVLEGEVSPSGIFELTEGAGLGRTWYWSIQGNYQISSYLRAALNYDGRTLVERPTIHTLRVTVSAVF